MEELFGSHAREEMDFEALETALRRRALQMAGRLVEQRFNRDHSDHQGSSLPCACGHRARYVERRGKKFQSVVGELNLERAYYYCSECDQGFCPRDRALGMDATSLSPAVLRMIGTVGAMVSFEEGHQLLGELADVHITAKQVERAAEALGGEIKDDERKSVEPMTEDAIPPTLYLGMDGTGVPLRPSEVRDRPGKQLDGSSKTREVKLCTVWSAESRDAQGLPTRDPGSVTYSAAIESAATSDTDREYAAFTERVWREAKRRHFVQALRTAVLGDGASWIWNLATELFPQAIQIVDRFHAQEHLSKVSHELYGVGAELAKKWAVRRYAELEAGQLGSLLQALSRQIHRSEEARKCLEYIKRNRHRMRYAEFHAQGLCTSTGVVEAGCKVIVVTRLKRAGMHWTVRGANAIIALRCCKLSGRFEDFWARRSHRKVA
jgi:hypothetical protein